MKDIAKWGFIFFFVCIIGALMSNVKEDVPISTKLEVVAEQENCTLYRVINSYNSYTTVVLYWSVCSTSNNTSSVVKN